MSPVRNFGTWGSLDFWGRLSAPLGCFIGTLQRKSPQGSSGDTPSRPDRAETVQISPCLLASNLTSRALLEPLLTSAGNQPHTQARWPLRVA